MERWNLQLSVPNPLHLVCNALRDSIMVVAAVNRLDAANLGEYELVVGDSASKEADVVEPGVMDAACIDSADPPHWVPTQIHQGRLRHFRSLAPGSSQGYTYLSSKEGFFEQFCHEFEKLTGRMKQLSQLFHNHRADD